MARKSIFITGAAGGIGSAAARLFAAKGWYVGLSDIRINEIMSVSDAIGPENCEVYLADVRIPEQLEKAISNFVYKAGGNLNTLLLCAGVFYSGGFNEVDYEKDKHQLDVNTLGVLNAAHAAFPHLKKTPSSTIVTMCSSTATHGNPEIMSYAASKAAVRSITEGLNLLMRNYDIHVCDILPYYVDTPLGKKAMEAMMYKQRSISISTDDIAKVIWQAIHSKRVHFYIGFVSKLFYWGKRMLPRPIFDYLLQRTYYRTALKKAEDRMKEGL